MAQYSFIGGDGKTYGPYSQEQMRQFMTDNRVNAQTQVSDDGSAWRAAGTIPELSGGAPQEGGPVQAYSPPPIQGAPIKVPNYLVHAILCTLCCCLPFGIVGIVYAAKVDGLANTGNTAAALEASGKAKMWCWIGLGVGLVVNIIIVGLQIAAGTL